MVTFQANRVLVPTDFSDQSCKAVEAALAMVARPEQLTVLHVATPMSAFTAGDPAVIWETVSDESRSEHLQQELRKRFHEKQFDAIKFEVLFGSPAEEITKYAENNQTELIVLPSHGRTGLARLMIGSVAERVVRLAHCPVLVLRC
jgi:nucleotide-binding universal stress UspA family protein